VLTQKKRCQHNGERPLELHQHRGEAGRQAGLHGEEQEDELAAEHEAADAG
jgi:hypothetical protein